MDGDVIAIEVTDERATPAPIRIGLRMLRPAIVRHFEQTATSRLANRNGSGCSRRRRLRKANYFCGSVVAVDVVGRKADSR